MQAMENPWRIAMIRHAKDMVSIGSAAVGGLSVGALFAFAVDLAEYAKPFATILMLAFGVGTGYWRYVKARNDARADQDE